MGETVETSHSTPAEPARGTKPFPQDGNIPRAEGRAASGTFPFLAPWLVRCGLQRVGRRPERR